MYSLKIGNILRELRGERSIAEVADAVGITPSAVGNYEQGIRIPRDEIKKKIAEYFGKSVGEIFFDQ